MKRWAALGLILALSGCTTAGDLGGFLPLFRSTPPKLDLYRADQDQLLGADSARVGLVLGTPDLIRTEGTAEIWHYSGDACRLLVFLYHDAPDAPPRLPTAEGRTAERKTIAGLTKANLSVAPAIGSGIVKHVAAWPAAAEAASCQQSVARRAQQARARD